MRYAAFKYDSFTLPEQNGSELSGHTQVALKNTFTRTTKEGVVGWCDGAGSRSVLLILIVVGQGPTSLVVGATRGGWTFFLSSIVSFFFPPLSGRLKYCLKGPLSLKPTNQQNQGNIVKQREYI